MKISNLTVVVCAGVLCAGISVRADDNAAQAAARAALMQKMQDMNSQGQPPPDQGALPGNQPEVSPPAETPVPAEPTTVAPENVQPTPPVQATAPANPPATFSAPPPPSTNPNAQAEERAVIAQEMERANAQATNPPAAETTEKKPGFFGRWLHHSHPGEPAAETNPIQPAANSVGQNPETAPVQTMPATKQPGFFGRLNPFHRSASAVMEMNRSQPSKNSGQNGFAPIQAPPPPVSPEKDAELHALLQRYEANQISPDQYQTDRAEILNSP